MMRNASARSLAVGFALIGSGLACALPGSSPAPAEIVLEPTIRPTLSEAALATLAGPAAQPQPTTRPQATAPAPPASGPGQIVLHQPFAIVIAYSGPETGTGSALFTPMQQAAQKAIEDHGPVHGYGVNLVAFNDDCTEEGGAAVAQQIVADERVVAVLGPACSKAVQGALPVLENANVVMLSGAATIPGLSAFGPSVFHRSLLDDDVAHALGYPSQIYIEDFPGVQSWLGAFAAWGGQLLETGLNHFAPYQYDATDILLQALDQTAALQSDGSLVIDREVLRATVRGTSNYPGVTGTITFEADGDRVP
jgi:ABC-type branched-subunit amino acid transport system substrate-binding protein